MYLSLPETLVSYWFVCPSKFSSAQQDCADVGVWGIAYDIFFFLTVGLILTSLVGHVTGVLDPYYNSNWMVAFGAMNVFTVLGLYVTYFISVVFRADDEYIGGAEIPLEILLDQREHALLVKLQNTDPSPTATCHNSERGILRVKLSLFE